jgi:hypothetical protein
VDEIQSQVGKLPKSFCKNINKNPKIRVASIQFGYDNEQVIKMMRKRGGFFIQGKGEKGDALEKKIFSHIEQNYEKNIRPVTAYVLFETQEG